MTRRVLTIVALVLVAVGLGTTGTVQAGQTPPPPIFTLPDTTTTTTTTTTTVAPTTSTTTTSTVAPTTTEVAVLPPTVAPPSPPVTLPATGSTSMELVLLSIALLVCGVSLVTLAARRS